MALYACFDMPDTGTLFAGASSGKFHKGAERADAASARCVPSRLAKSLHVDWALCAHCCFYEMSNLGSTLGVLSKVSKRKPTVTS
jgi:hypothetical protein